LAFRLGLLGHEAAPSASDATLVLRSLFTFHPDALVLDLRDSRDGKELFQLLYKVSELPIIVLGDGTEPAKAVWFLEEGAADYLARPVPHKVLSARISALLRRTSANGDSGPIQVGPLEIDAERHVVLRDGRAISLTPIEFRLLRVLAEHAGSACKHRMLLAQVWGEDFRHCSHYLRLYIGYLRNKLEEDPRNPKILVTEWGVGYRLVAGARGTIGKQAGVRPRVRYA
jgi:two-component system KDP operon response regulator KdpE